MATRNVIILNKPEQWPIWIENIRGLIPDEIWPLINPDAVEHEEILQKPAMPRIQDVNAARTSIAEFSANERNIFDMMFRYYTGQLKEYERQSKGLQDAKTLIQARVSDAKAELLRGNESAREWLLVLRRSTSASQAYISFQEAQKYYESLRKIPTPSTISNWLSTWEHAMVGAIKHNIPEIGSGRWLRDLAIAIKPVSDVLNAMFITESTDDQRTDPSRYLEASVRIRELVETNMPRKRTVTRGLAFAAEFGGELADDGHYQDAGNKKKSFKRARTPSAPKNLPENKRQKTGCRACGLYRHPLSRCFYVFPELRPQDFKPHQYRVNKVSQALKDFELSKEVEAIREERQDGKEGRDRED
jgi:hypothetical protein